jgi:hypothetical protein
MGNVAGRQEELTRAVDAALAGDWEAAHAIAQRHEGDSAADWLHAVLHKIEGDTGTHAIGIAAPGTHSKSSVTLRANSRLYGSSYLVKRSCNGTLPRDSAGTTAALF